MERRFRLITQLLILSVALNIGLLLSLGLRTIQSKKSEKSEIALKVRESSVPSENYASVIKNYFEYSFYHLVDSLNDTTYVQDGFSKRDFALTCLVDFHDLDIDRAMQGRALQKRKMMFAHEKGREMLELSLFPGLESEDFSTITAFIKQEKWPLTARGLFLALTDKCLEQRPDDLYEAFEKTECYQMVSALFQRNGFICDACEISNMIVEGDWDSIHHFVLTERENIDLSPRVFDAFLLKLLQQGSGTSFQACLENGREDLFRRLDDELMTQLVGKVSRAHERVDAFLKKSLISVRSDNFREAAGMALLKVHDQEVPDNYNHEAIVTHFLPQLAKGANRAKPVLQGREYVVQSGDSLWLIAKKHGVSVDEIIQVNDLKSQRLDVGMELLIP